ncbi:MAG: glutamine-hydrolyzing carbamoyl-phosphate synthase small subunit [Ruminococcus sp.]|nr:glutamine-hydrolyzing carbamoyl-phosphate synthase small subunit [Ruminococcus sp.]MBQ6336833.1 glutamine-hydrolyzing carbamoyl-phosphate synthase small subunit [Ruminococcus sp.]
MKLYEFDKKLILEDGSEYFGKGFGDHDERVFEIVFNTSSVGYQEILSDPSYTDQGVVFAYPLIGNYGISADDFETKTPTIGAMIVREFCPEPSNYRSIMTLEEVMKQNHIVGISEIDTRKLVCHIRDVGSCRAMIADINTDTAQAIKELREHVPPTDAVSRVSRKETEAYAADNAEYHVVAIDCGMKENIIRSLVKRNCRVTAVPWNTRACDILALHPDGLFLSNGPGDPQDVPEVIETVKALHGKLPIFGVCLGHQILSLSYGAKTYKLNFGHRGGNHPIKNLATDKIEITAQNHSYAVDADSLNNTPLEVTHINLLDNTVEGVESVKDRVFGVQYHPESAPGPQDSSYLFDRFIELMEEVKHHA